MIRSAAEVLGARFGHSASTRLTHDEYRLMAQAFEQMRDGYAPGRLLWNRSFARSFVDRCRQAGLKTPEDVLKRQMIAVRKDPARFARMGIALSPTTKRETHAAPRDECIPAIEFALVRLRYRYGASIDDILLSTELGRQFEKSAQAIVGDASPEELRLGALYLRKTRKTTEAQRLLGQENVSSEMLEAEMVDVGCLSNLHAQEVPESRGILRVTEGPKYLFVSRYKSLRASLTPFVDGSALEAMADRFWVPDRDEMHISTFVGDEFGGLGLEQWQICLIYDRRPLFNWPVRPHAA